MQQKYTIDRFEEDYAVCRASDGRVVNIPFEDIPENSVGGDVLVYQEGRYIKDKRATAAANRRNQKNLQSLMA